jgi:hypothetical protein
MNTWFSVLVSISLIISQSSWAEGVVDSFKPEHSPQIAKEHKPKPPAKVKTNVNQPPAKKTKKKNKGVADPCTPYMSVITSIVGTAQAQCYKKLFMAETTCNPFKYQPAGNVGNRYSAYGFCSIVKDYAPRKKYGPECRDIESIAGQVKCCQKLMRKYPTYFGPVNRKEIPRCY